MSNSPFKIPAAVPLASMFVSTIGGFLGARSAARDAEKARREAEEKERLARLRLEKQKEIYAGLDTSNPYLNMENVMEDLTVNQQQAQFEKQQFQQSQANIMDSLRGAAGGSGVAALAQQLAQSGQLAAQRSAASIGQQEAANQRAAAAQAGRIQSMERQGEVMSRNWERDKQATLLGMEQAEAAAYGQRAQQAQQAKWSAIAGGFGGAAQSLMSGMQSGVFDNLGQQFGIGGGINTGGGWDHRT